MIFLPIQNGLFHNVQLMQERFTNIDNYVKQFLQKCIFAEKSNYFFFITIASIYEMLYL